MVLAVALKRFLLPHSNLCNNPAPMLLNSDLAVIDQVGCLTRKYGKLGEPRRVGIKK